MSSDWRQYPDLRSCVVRSSGVARIAEGLVILGEQVLNVLPIVRGGGSCVYEPQFALVAVGEVKIKPELLAQPGLPGWVILQSKECAGYGTRCPCQAAYLRTKPWRTAYVFVPDERGEIFRLEKYARRSPS